MIKIVSYRLMQVLGLFSGRWNKPYNAFTLAGFPLIIVKEKHLLDSDKRINHEMIHFWQSIYLLIIGFWIFYILNFIINLFIYRNANKAYRNIILEREAYDNDDDLTYLFHRKPYGWINYIRAKE